ncbi:MAG: DNA adenine methylase [Anaerolineae bacterium]|nr:DNA adenine methylase [Anaerolineae bacterium]
MSIIKHFGGKHFIARKIAGMFPPHRTYVEPFGGGASVLLAKSPSPIEVYNDLDGRLTNFFRVLRDYPDELARRLRLTPYSEWEFRHLDDQPPSCPIEQARRDYVRWRFSFAGNARTFAFSVERTRRGMPEVISAHLSAVDEELPRIYQRLIRVIFLCRDAFLIIPRWDSPSTLFYLDPPYPESTVYEIPYAAKMSDADHERLCHMLRGLKGMVFLSSYRNEIYDSILSDWKRVEIPVPNFAQKSPQKSIEVETLYINPAALERHSALPLFKKGESKMNEKQEEELFSVSPKEIERVLDEEPDASFDPTTLEELVARAKLLAGQNKSAQPRQEGSGYVVFHARKEEVWKA